MPSRDGLVAPQDLGDRRPERGIADGHVDRRADLGA
jgi:hypothetical protein